MFIYECPWDQYLGNGGSEAEMGNSKNQDCSDFPKIALANPRGNSGARMDLQLS